MSVFRPRIIQQLRIAAAHQRRQYATAGSAKPRRSRLTYGFYAGTLLSGLAGGYAVRQFLSPAALLEPTSREDQVALDMLIQDIDKIPVVKELRAQTYNLHSDIPLAESGTGKGGWVELSINKNLKESKDDTVEPSSVLSQQTLAGFRGFGVQRAFWNSETRELIAIVWFGGALQGWPAITHGGAIATLFEDAMCRTVAGPEASISSNHLPTSMSVTYLRPTQVLNHYILQVSFLNPDLPQAIPAPEPEPAKSWLPRWKDLTKKDSPAPERSVEVSATLTSLDDKLYCKAKGVFSASAARNLLPEKMK